MTHPLIELLIKLFCFSSDFDETWRSCNTQCVQQFQQVSSKFDGKKGLLIACFSVQNFKVAVELWKLYIVWTGTRNMGFGYPQYSGEIGRRQVEQGFSFVAYLMIFQSGACGRHCDKLWKIIKYGKNLAKNEEKLHTTCFQFAFNKFFTWFQVPVPPLYSLQVAFYLSL